MAKAKKELPIKFKQDFMGVWSGTIYVTDKSHNSFKTYGYQCSPSTKSRVAHAEIRNELEKRLAELRVEDASLVAIAFDKWQELYKEFLSRKNNN